MTGGAIAGGAITGLGSAQPAEPVDSDDVETAANDVEIAFCYLEDEVAGKWVDEGRDGVGMFVTELNDAMPSGWNAHWVDYTDPPSFYYADDDSYGEIVSKIESLFQFWDHDVIFFLIDGSHVDNGLGAAGNLSHTYDDDDSITGAYLNVDFMKMVDNSMSDGDLAESITRSMVMHELGHTVLLGQEHGGSPLEVKNAHDTGSASASADSDHAYGYQDTLFGYPRISAMATGYSWNPSSYDIPYVNYMPDYCTDASGNIIPSSQYSAIPQYNNVLSPAAKDGIEWFFDNEM